MTKKILFVGMVDSPHTARWIRLLAEQNWELHFFPVYCAPAHSLLKGATVHLPWKILRPRTQLKRWFSKFLAFMGRPVTEQRSDTNQTESAIYAYPIIRPLDKILGKLMTRPLGESDIRAPLAYGPKVLAKLIKKLQPDLVHSMEFQHAGYLTLKAASHFASDAFPKWLATNWGSDIFYYQQFPSHQQQIKRLLERCDYYSCECQRDVTLAKDLGFAGKVMPVMPNTGGFDIKMLAESRKKVKTSQRKLIMVKGYQHFAGRALTALNAIEKCAQDLQGFRVAVFSASSSEVIERVETLRLLHGIDICILQHTSHARMIEFFSHARIYLGVSASDGISTSMLEAIAMGAFPIQTNTSCCEEWIVDKQTGYVIPADDEDVIAQRVRAALSDDHLVDTAAEQNWQTVCERLDNTIVKEKELSFYQEIFSDIKDVE